MQSIFKLSDFQITLQHKNTDDGLKFIHFKKASAPISIKICSRSGSRFDSLEKSGLAHFVEHIVLDGTEKYPNKKILSLKFDDIGGSFSATTGAEYTRFDFLVAKMEHLNFVADAVDQIFNKPLLEDKNIALEKNIIKTEISSKLDNNKRVLSNNMRTLIYGDNPIAYNVSGTEESVSNLTRNDILFHLKNIFPQDMTVVSCGSCDVDDIYCMFEPIIPKSNQKIILETPKISTGKRYGSFKMLDQKLVYCMLTFPIGGIGSDDDVPQALLSNYLGNGRSSLLTEILRYDEGLVYSVSSGNNRYSDTGYFFIEFGVKKENLKIVFDKINIAIQKVVKDGIEQKAFDVLKNKITNTGIIATQTVQFWTENQFYKELLIKDNERTYTDFLNTVSIIDKQTVDLVAKNVLDPENMFFYAVGNIEDGEIDSLLK